MADDFSEAPISLAEVRATREANSALWSPREALIELLRRIDSGEEAVEGLIIVHYRTIDEGRTKTQFSNATPNMQTALGLLSRAEWLMNEGD